MYILKVLYYILHYSGTFIMALYKVRIQTIRAICSVCYLNYSNIKINICFSSSQIFKTVVLINIYPLCHVASFLLL